MPKNSPPRHTFDPGQRQPSPVKAGRMATGGRRLIKRPCLVALATSTLLLLLLQLPFLFQGGCRQPGQCQQAEAHDFLQVFPHRQWRPHQEKTVLLYTTFFGGRAWDQVELGDPQAVFRTCPVPHCRLVWDHALEASNDALLFHAMDLWNFWKGHPLPAARAPHQVWVFMNVEPPPHVPLNLARFDGVFNWTLSYRSDADVKYDTGAFVRRDLPRTGETTLRPTARNVAREKSRVVAWMASNCMDHARRRRLVKALAQYVKVDTFGACGETRPNCSSHLCEEVLRPYKFYLSFENSLCRDYVTEKLWHAFRRDQVPVVLGGANYSAHLPPHSFINAADFSSMRELGLYLNYLDKTDSAYNAYLEWRQHYELVHPRFWCRLCAQLHNHSKPAQVYTDLQAWFQHGELQTCPQFTLTNYLSRALDAMLITVGVQ